MKLETALRVLIMETRLFNCNIKSNRNNPEFWLIGRNDKPTLKVQQAEFKGEIVGIERLSRRKLPLFIIALLVFSTIFLLIHAISGSEEAFIIGARLFIACIILGVTLTIIEAIKAKNLPYSYSIIGLLFGLMSFFLLPADLQLFCFFRRIFWSFISPG